MQDRVPLYPGRVKLTPVSGQANTYDMVRADEPTQEGTPLSKATFLKDATAALFGMDENAVPDDVFGEIANLVNWYVWDKFYKRYEYQEIRFEGSWTVQGSSSSNARQFYASEHISIDENGNISLEKPVGTATFIGGNGDTNAYVANYISGKYIKVSPTTNGTTCDLDPEKVYYVSSANAGNYALTVYGYEISSELVEIYDYVGHIVTYTNNTPVEEGYAFFSRGQIGNKVQISTGSYTGTGTYGSSNPNSLTFEFEPKIVFLRDASGGYPVSPYFWGANITTIYNGTNSYIYPTVFGNKMSWYSEKNATLQLNSSGVNYSYVAIG